MWVVYDHPADYPDWYVARLSLVTADGVVQTAKIKLAEHLSSIETELSDMGLVPIDRSPDDDPVIVRTWL